MADAVSTVDVRVAPAEGESRLSVIARTVFPFLVVGAMWEITAHAGIFPPRLFPTLEEIGAAFWRLTVAGILPHHVAETLLRLFAGFALAAIIGVTVGIAMGRSRRAEDILLPLVSIGAPIPGIAYAPLFMLWFGLGNFSDHPAGRLCVRLPDHLQYLDRGEGGQGNLGALGAGHGRGPAAAVPARDPARRAALHLHRPAAWAGAGVAHPRGGRTPRRGALGPGRLIFGAREFLNTDVMLAGVAVIGMVGLTLEKLVFERLERYTVVRWGMMQS